MANNDLEITNFYIASGLKQCYMFTIVIMWDSLLWVPKLTFITLASNVDCMTCMAKGICRS